METTQEIKLDLKGLHNWLGTMPQEA